MAKLRQLVLAFFVCSTILISGAFAQGSLTRIQDIVYNVDGSTFAGTLTINSSGFTGPTGSTLGPQSASTQIVNGVLSVSLVPSTTASAGAYYVATYNSSDGTITFTEIWQVPPSNTPLKLSQVRQPAGSGGGGGGGGGGVVYATIPISLDEITGLNSDLNALNGSFASLSATVNTVIATVTSLGVQVANLTAVVNNLPSGSGSVFADAETPSGTINGTDAVFNLTGAPAPAASLTLYRNGLVQTRGMDFTLAGAAITFASNNLPQPGDVLQAYYRTAGTGQASNFEDALVPTGTINGANLAFALPVAPNPALSLKLYKNGVLLKQNGDYALSGVAITFTNASTTPQSGDSLVAFYRH